MCVVAQGFISDCKALDKPFLLYFNPTTPRAPDVYASFFNFTIFDTPAGEDPGWCCFRLPRLIK